MQLCDIFENTVLVIVIVAMLPVAFVIGYAFCAWVYELRQICRRK